MPESTISETLNINVTHATPGPTPTPVDPIVPVPHTSGAGAPNTGFFENLGNFASHMSITGWLFIIITILLISAGILCIFWRKKFQHKAHTFFGLFFFAFAIGFIIPSINAVSQALNLTNTEHTTTFDITTTDTSTVFIAQTTDLTLPEPPAGKNYDYGYSVLARFDDAEDNTIYNTDKTSKITAIINPVSDPEDFDNHTYGIKNVVDIYDAPPVGTEGILPVVRTSTSASAGDTILPITYAFKLDSTLPEGEYTGKIVYVITPNPVRCNPSATTISEAVCLQDMNASIKASMAPGTQYQLVDIRDEKQYSVALLADGEVWMTQNLALELDSTKIYTADDTDLNSVEAVQNGWKPDHTTYNQITGTGEWAVVIGGHYSIVNPTGAPNNAGVYYNWMAAIAAGGTVPSPGEPAPDSVCPKGWQLPIGGSADASNNQFTKLFTAYGWDSGSYMMPAADTLTTPPINFVLAGQVQTDDGTVSHSGSSGYFWAPIFVMSMFGVNGYDGNFASDGRAYPGGADYINYGQSVRCVAR